MFLTHVVTRQQHFSSLCFLIPAFLSHSSGVTSPCLSLNTVSAVEGPVCSHKWGGRCPEPRLRQWSRWEGAVKHQGDKESCLFGKGDTADYGGMHAYSFPSSNSPKRSSQCCVEGLRRAICHPPRWVQEVVMELNFMASGGYGWQEGVVTAHMDTVTMRHSLCVFMCIFFGVYPKD